MISARISKITNAAQRSVLENSVEVTLDSFETAAIRYGDKTVINLLEQTLASEEDNKIIPEEYRSSVREIHDLLSDPYSIGRSTSNSDVLHYLHKGIAFSDAITLFREQLSEGEKGYVRIALLQNCKTAKIQLSTYIIEGFLKCPAPELDKELASSRHLLTTEQQKIVKSFMQQLIIIAYIESHAVYRLDGKKPIHISNIGREPLGILGISALNTAEQKINAVDVQTEITRMIEEKIAKWKNVVRLKETFKTLTPPAENAIDLVVQMQQCALENISDLKAEGGLTPLHVAVAHGQKELVSWCVLDRGMDANAAVSIDYDDKIQRSMTAFTIAASKANRSELENLLSIPTLQKLAQTKFSELTIETIQTLGQSYLKALRDHDANIHGLKTSSGHSPLHVAVLTANETDIRWCLRKDNIDIRDKEGCTPLFYAKDKAVASLLLAAGANVGIQVDSGITLLHHMVAYKYDTDVLDVIVHRLSAVSAKDHGGHTPLFYAIRNSYLAAVELLLKHYDFSIEVEIEKKLAEKSGNQDCIRLLNAHVAQQQFRKLSCADPRDKIMACLEALQPHLTDSMIHRLTTTLHGLSLLHIAAMAGHKALVERCLAAGMDKNILCEAFGSTPLMYLAQRYPREDPKAIQEIVSLLLGSGDEVNRSSNNKTTALHFAVIANNLPVVRILLSFPHTKIDIAQELQNAAPVTAAQAAATSSHPGIRRLFAMKVEAEEKSSAETLHSLAEKGEVEAIKQMVQADPSTMHTKDKEGNTGLHLAIMMEQAEAAKWLFEQNTNAFAVNNMHESAYDLAVAIGKPELTALFGNVNQAVENVKKLTMSSPNEQIKTSLAALAPYLTSKMVQTLRTTECKSSLLHLAMIICDEQRVEKYLSMEADKKALDNFKYTPLMRLAWNAHVRPSSETAIIHLFLKSSPGIDAKNEISIDAADNAGMTALHHAVFNKKLTLIKELLIAGAKTDIKTTQDWPADTKKIPTSSLACRESEPHPGIRYLFSKYKTKLAQIEEKSTSETLFSLVEKGDVEEMQRLFVAEPSVIHAKDNEGNTALHVAIMMEQTEAAQWLFKQDTNAFAVNNQGESAYDIAAEINKPELTALFEKAHQAAEDIKKLTYLSSDTQIKTSLATLTPYLTPRLIQTLKTNNCRSSLLHLAMIICDEQLVGKYLAMKGDKKALDNFKHTPLMRLAWDDCVRRSSETQAIIQLFLKRSPGIDAKDEIDIDATSAAEMTALHYAVFYKKLTLIKELLIAGAKTDIKTTQDWPVDTKEIPAGSFACRENEPHPGIRYLFSKYKTKPAQIEEKSTSKTLFSLVEKGDVEEMQRLFVAEPSVIHAKDNEGNTALHVAIMMEQTEAAQWLFKQDTNAFAVNNQGESAYDIAAEINKPELTALFEKAHQAAEDIKKLTYLSSDTQIKTSLATLTPYLTPRLIQTLKTNNCRSSLLHLAMIICDEQLVGKYLAMKGDKKALDKYKATPLMRLAWDACVRRSSETQAIIHLFLKSSPDIDAKDETDINATSPSGITALHYAVLNKKLILIKELLIAGAKTDIKTMKDWPAATKQIPAGSLACRENETHPGIRYLFEKYKTKPNQVEEKSISETLHDLAEKGDVASIKKMRENNSTMNINERDANNNTALHIAAMMEQVSVVRYLLERQADASLLNNEEETPYSIAYCTNNNDLMSLFPQHAPVTAYKNLNNKSDPAAIRAAIAGIIPLGKMAYSLITKDDGRNLLYWAVLARDTDIIKLCMEKVRQGKMDLHTKDAGHSALDYAKEDAEIVALLNLKQPLASTNNSPGFFRAAEESLSMPLDLEVGHSLTLSIVV